jgi:hypothetical protein
VTRPFEFEDWINKCLESGLGYKDLIDAAAAASGKAQRETNRRKSRYQEQAGYFDDQLGQLLYWLRFGAKPNGVSDRDWQLYDRVLDALAQQGDTPPWARRT